MSEKKMVRRSIGIALGIICIILVAGLRVLSMSYSSTTITETPEIIIARAVSAIPR